MSQLINRINQGNYDTEKELTNLRNNALRLKNKGVLRAVNKRLRKCFPAIFQKIAGGTRKKSNVKNKQKKIANMSTIEKKKYLNKLFGYDREYGDDIFDRGKVVSGGAFGMN